MSGGLRLHPRYFTVAEATNTLRLTFLKIEERLDLTIDRVIGILLQIATETNKAEELKDRNYPIGLDEVGEEFFKELKKTEEKYGLTQGESLRILLEATANEVKYLIRHERHPNNPDKKGDEA
jgi:antitoxin component of RelBE/YafQ-DinJ toxin-antitoxin module